MFYNFIICEDNNFFNESYQEIVKKVAKDLKINIKIHSFKNYNEDFKNIIYDNNIENKIYILDLLMPIKCGDEIARMIRQTDLASFIIFITGLHDQYEDEIVSGEYFYLKFIDKEDDYKSILYDVLERNITKKQNIQTLKIEIKNQFYQIVPNEITHIYTEDRKIVIENIQDDSIIIPTTLNNIKQLLPEQFVFSKNCCLVNLNRIKSISKSERIIHFDNGKSTNLVSRIYLKKIINSLKKDLENI